jgi:hypothetical protein
MSKVLTVLIASSLGCVRHVGVVAARRRLDRRREAQTQIARGMAVDISAGCA